MNIAAKIHTPQIVATVLRDVGCEGTRTWNGFSVTLYRLMISTATDYADRSTQKRRRNGRDVRLIYRNSSKRIFCLRDSGSNLPLNESYRLEPS